MKLKKSKQFLRINFLLILSLYIPYACSTKNEQKVIILDDLSKESKNYSKNEQTEADTIKKESIIVVEPNIKSFIEIVLKSETTVNSDSTKYILDRFSSLENYKYNFTEENKMIKVAYWKYKDSVQTNTVFLNWLNCMNENCTPIQIFERKKVFQDNTYIIKGKKSIFMIEPNFIISSNDFKNLVEKFNEDDRIHYILVQQRKQPINWFEYNLDDKQVRTIK